jgi:hypothetical protein
MLAVAERLPCLRQAKAKCNSLSVRRQPNIARVFVRGVGVGFYDALPNLRIFGVSTNALNDFRSVLQVLKS